MKIALASLLIVMIAAGSYVYKHEHTSSKTSVTAPTTAVTKTSAKKPAAQPKPVAQATTRCSGNDLSQLVVVSISDRHMWACEGSKQVYDNPVITGMEFLASDLTPTGTYHIYSKQTDLHLRGSDSTGSWDDPVSYWMPFLSNKYGVYGFHDATWRQDSDFGNVSPDSKNASHGCVELPLAAAKWLYNWSVVGTTLTIQS